MAITSTGVGSGLPVDNIVSSLMALEKRPLELLQTRYDTIQTKISAFGSLKGSIASLGDVASRLADKANWNPLRVDVADSAVASASASSAAVAGKYKLQVSQLAQAQSLASGTYASSTAAVGTGSLKIELGTTAGGVFTAKADPAPVTVTIGPDKNTLAGVRDAINASKSGVTASIVGTGASSRLVLRGADGAENSVRITATDDDGNNTDGAGLSALAFDPAGSAGAGRNLSQTQAAQDAKYTLDGLELTSPTNTLTGVVEGLTLTLKKETTAPTDVNVSVETVAVQKNINDFVNAYNALNTLVKAQTQADPSGKSRGALQADSTAVNLLTQMREMLRGDVAGASPASLNAAGIELQRDGSLKVNTTKLTPLLSTPAKLQQLFGQPQAGSDLASRGFGVRFKAWAGQLTGETGVLASRLEGLNSSASSNQKQQDSLEDRLLRTEARIRAQYQRLDSQMNSLQGQMAQMQNALGLGSA